MRLDQVGEAVELRLTGRRERDTRGDEGLASAPRHFDEEGRTEGVLLEEAVESGPKGPGTRVDGAVVAGAVDVVEMHPPGRRRTPGCDPVVDLVAADPLAHSHAPPLPRHLLRRECGLGVEHAETLDRAPAGLDVVADPPPEHLVAGADPKDDDVGARDRSVEPAAPK